MSTEVDAQTVIQQLAQQLADQAVTIAMLRAQIQQMQTTATPAGDTDD